MYIIVVSTVLKVTNSHSAPHADRRCKLNAKCRDTITPDIIEAATISHSLADMTKLPYAGSRFIERDDCPGTHKLNARSGSSNVSLDSITHKESMSPPNPQCLQIV